MVGWGVGAPLGVASYAVGVAWGVCAVGVQRTNKLLCLELFFLFEFRHHLIRDRAWGTERLAVFDELDDFQ